MEDRWGLTRVIDNDVVDVVIVDYVGNVAARALGLNPLLLLRVSWWGTPAAHSEALTI